MNDDVARGLPGNPAVGIDDDRAVALIAVGKRQIPHGESPRHESGPRGFRRLDDPGRLRASGRGQSRPETGGYPGCPGHQKSAFCPKAGRHALPFPETLAGFTPAYNIDRRELENLPLAAGRQS
jgi:hypothetical protein